MRLSVGNPSRQPHWGKQHEHVASDLETHMRSADGGGLVGQRAF